MNYLLLVNKNNPLGSNFIPNNLVVVENRKRDKPNLLLLLDKEVCKHFLLMIKVAYVEEKLDIICDSAYRSYDYQKSLYEELVKKGNDPKYLAKPGESEHQTGLCVDIAAYQNGEYVDDPNKLNKEYDWLEKNAHRFGFILRYPKNKECITGYPYEPWHFRYVGVEHAKVIKENNLTLEEYLEK